MLQSKLFSNTGPTAHGCKTAATLFKGSTAMAVAMATDSASLLFFVAAPIGSQPREATGHGGHAAYRGVQRRPETPAGGGETPGVHATTATGNHGDHG